jgi:hypothetical protein
MKLFYGFFLFTSFFLLFLSFSDVLNTSDFIFNKDDFMKVCFWENCFLSEIAKTKEDFFKGLMFRQKLDEDKGMIFDFGKDGVYSFWMKNTLIPLDIIWINNENKVVFIKKNAEPCSESSCPLTKPDKKARYVLEINAGISEKINLQLGDTAVFSY